MTKKDIRQRVRNVLKKAGIDADALPEDKLIPYFHRLMAEIRSVERARVIKADTKKYKRTGKCKQCGMCCSPFTLFGILQDPMIGHCKFLRSKTKKGKTTYRCIDYANRPKWCREFPRHPEDIKYLPNCGYKFEVVK